MFRSHSTGLGAVVFAGALLFAFPAWAQEDDAAGLMELLFKLQQAVEGDADRYSIGIAVEPENGGLNVREVRPNSAAAKAGVQKGDLIQALNRAPVSKVADLAQGIAESKGAPVHLQIIRDGKAQAISVKPEQRAGGLLQLVEELEEEHSPQKPPPQRQPAGNPETRFQLRSPGQPGAAARGLTFQGPTTPHPSLPDDMEVTISKKGNKPAVIKVTQGVKSWKTDETELSMLPPPAQAYVARHLGKPPAPFGMTPGAPMPSGAPQAGGMQFNLKLGKDGKAEQWPPRKIAPKGSQLPAGGLEVK